MERKFYLDEEIPYFFKDNIKYNVNKNTNTNQEYKLAIVGSRSIKDENKINKLLDSYEFIFGKPSLVISGGAIGVDSIGEQWAKKNNIEIQIFKPDWVKYGKRAGFIRNEDIIKNCDGCLAIWDGESNGTKHDIELCEKYKKELLIYNVKESSEGEFNGFYLKLFNNELKIDLEVPGDNPGQNKPLYQNYNRWLPQPGIIKV